MINYRHGIFETNSSSTHAMVVTSRAPKYEPSALHFEFDDFGWEFSVLTSMAEKAAYLYTAAVNIRQDYKGVQQTLRELLPGIKLTFEKPRYSYYGDYKFLENGSVDHVGTDEQLEFVNTMLTDSDALKRYLFSEESYVVTGNDNCDKEQYEWFKHKEEPDYPHTTYYKGN